MPPIFNFNGDTIATSATINGALYYNPTGAPSATETGSAIVNSATVGLISGGDISIVSGLTISVAAGAGYISEGTFPTQYITRISWSTTQLTLTADTTNYIYATSSGLTANVSRPDELSTILCGRVRSQSSSIEFIDAQKYNARNPVNDILRRERDLYGALYSTGSVVTANTSRQLAISSGRYYYLGRAYTPSGQASPATWLAYYHSSSNWTTATQTVVNNTQYDNGTDLTSLTSSYYTKHTMYIVGEGSNEKYLLVFGDAQYQQIADARAGDLSTTPVYFSEGVIPIATIIVQQGNATLTEISSIVPSPTSGTGSSSIDLSTIDINSLSNILSVSKGGTGVSSMTTGNFLTMGSSSVATTKAVPAGIVVGTTDTQTLTSKTLTTPIINATTINGNPSAAGHVLRATSTSAASWSAFRWCISGMLSATTTSSTYVVIDGNIIFPGSDDATPISVSFCARCESGSSSGSIRIYDTTNAAQICEATGISSTDDVIVSGGTLSNISTGQAMWQVQIKLNSGDGPIRALGYIIRF